MEDISAVVRFVDNRRPMILVGGQRRDAATYMDRINQKVKRLESALRPNKKRKVIPGEERQLLLPGFDR